jgi:hypothetical protein
VTCNHGEKTIKISAAGQSWMTTGGSCDVAFWESVAGGTRFVARMERSDIRVWLARLFVPDFAALNPGYAM